MREKKNKRIRMSEETGKSERMGLGLGLDFSPQTQTNFLL